MSSRLFSTIGCGWAGFGMRDTLIAPGRKTSVSVAERRLTVRVRRKWQTIAEGRLPSLKEVEALDWGEDWEYCFAVDLRLSDIFPYFLFMGEALSSYSVAYPLGDSRREKTLLDTAIIKMDEAAITRAPVEFSDVKQLADGRRVAFRSILLPVSENGRDVTHVFGAASGRSL